MNKQVNQFVNDIARDSGGVLSGTNNAAMILAIGMIFGYGLAIIGAWVISSSVGFMSFVFSIGYFKEFITFDLTAFLISFLIIGLIVFI